MAENKNIANLNFNINDAINSLEKVDEKLKSISQSSENYAKKIGDNLSKGLNAANIIDTKGINTNLNNISSLSKSKSEALSAQLIKIKAKEQSNINEIVTKGEQQRQTAAYKSALKQEEYNNRVLKSTQTLYDKITDYAKTYIIYQGFNQLKQTITSVIDEMVELENQMVSIDRVLNESTLDLDAYRDQLLQVAYDYGNTLDNVADITLRLAQAGFDSQESLMLTQKTLLALNTAELDATEATDDMVAIMAQWGLMTGNATEEAQAYGDIIDKINKVADKYTTSSADILDALNWEFKTNIPPKEEKTYNFSEEEKLIYDILRKDSLTMDEIVTKTNLNINDLMVILTKLELDGVISQTHGEKYIIIN